MMRFFGLIAAALLLHPTPDVRSQEKKPLRLLIAVTQGTKELKELQKYLEKNYRVECTMIEADRAKPASKFKGDIDALQNCDVILSNLYRTSPATATLAKLKKAFLTKPIVGLRKAHHGFQNWLEADKEVFGVDYRGHYGNKNNGFIELVDKHKNHPFFKELKVTIPGGGCYGHIDLSPDLEVYMVGGKQGQKPHPQTWSRIVKERDGQRVFYTRYDPNDIKNNPGVREMVVQAIFWAAQRDMNQLKR